MPGTQDPPRLSAQVLKTQIHRRDGQKGKKGTSVDQEDARKDRIRRNDACSKVGRMRMK